MTNTPETNTKAQRRWHQFHLWQLLVLLAGCSVIGSSIKNLIDFRAAKTKFYDAISDDELAQVQRLVQVYPSLLRSRSPTIRTGWQYTKYTAGETPVWCAVHFESRDVFTYLMTLNPDVKSEGLLDPPILHAVFKDDIYYLKVLLDHGADPSVRDIHGKTASDYARQYEKEDFLYLIASHCSQVGKSAVAQQ